MATVNTATHPHLLGNYGGRGSHSHSRRARRLVEITWHADVIDGDLQSISYIRVVYAAIARKGQLFYELNPH